MRGSPRKACSTRCWIGFRGPRDTAWLLLGGIGVFLGLMVLFFSSFLGNYPKGLHDAVGALKFWANVGAKEHRHGLGTYVSWLGQEELPLLVLGVAGTTVAAVMRQRFALFAGLWAFGLLAAYSFIPYKTPWLTINFIIPLAIVAGYAVEVIHRMLSARSTTSAWIWLALFVVAMTSSIYSALQA
jgi:predicted membrane-bound mannosyltransferase